MRYFPHAEEEIEQMLEAIGLDSLDDLYQEVPNELLLKRELDIPKGMSEDEILRHFSKLANRNVSNDTASCYLGGGVYDHLIPKTIDFIASRGEFLTAYTPYQPEASQGTLQVIFEFQTSIARLCGQEIANASMYDGATACAEAVAMAYSLNNRRKVVFSGSVNPEYREVTRTYLQGRDHTLVNWDGPLRHQDHEVLDAIDDETSCVVVQLPAFTGDIHDFSAIVTKAQSHNALVVAVYYPTALSMIEPIGGVDIAVGEGQPLGNYMGFGGPHFGFMATKQSMVRKLPGRIVGETVDTEGRRAYCLTFQTREQHIRRDKATSNICTNQGLCALRGQLYMSLMGEIGMRQVAEQCFHKAHYLAGELDAISGVTRLTRDPFFNEFVIELPKPAVEVVDAMGNHDILAGISMTRFGGADNQMMVAVTERRTREELDHYAATLQRVLQ